jgi:hypothetical protein
MLVLAGVWLGGVPGFVEFRQALHAPFPRARQPGLHNLVVSLEQAGLGLFEAVMSRFPPEQREYFESFPWWAVAFWAIGVPPRAA